MRSTISRTSKSNFFIAFSSISLAMAIFASTNLAMGQAIQKDALIVALSKYAKDGLKDLSFADKDGNDLATELSKNDFQVEKIIGPQATKRNVQAKLEAFFNKTKKRNKNDIVLISFSGHGRQKEVVVGTGNQARKVETPFFCVYDTLKSDPTTMISLNWVIQQLTERSGSSNNLLLVDACRDNPDKGAKSLDGSTVRELPTKISILFGSSPGQESFEATELKQGIFTHVLLRGIRGEAKNSRDQIDWLRLAAHVVSEVPLVARDLGYETQRPNLIGNSIGSPVLVKLNDPTPPPLLFAPFSKAEIRQARQAWARSLGVKESVTNNVGMKFNLIPAGRYQMGSPESESERSEDEYQHAVEITRPFYFGIYEVTQKEYQRVMKTNPSYFASTGEYKSRVSGLDTSDFPVENISWNDAQKFIETLNSLDRTAKYRLPTEAEWEYACRAGTTTPFSFGAVLDGKNANCDGNYPYGTTVKGRYLNRTSKAGSYLANPFGLSDMHGNVWEMVDDWYDGDYVKNSPLKNPIGPKSGSSRVLRGGSWFSYATFVRSAYRYFNAPAYRDYNTGFRVVREL